VSECVCVRVCVCVCVCVCVLIASGSTCACLRPWAKKIEMKRPVGAPWWTACLRSHTIDSQSRPSSCSSSSLTCSHAVALVHYPVLAHVHAHRTTLRSCSRFRSRSRSSSRFTFIITTFFRLRRTINRADYDIFHATTFFFTIRRTINRACYDIFHATTFFSRYDAPLIALITTFFTLRRFFHDTTHH
jgi:hypothetical protein